MSAVSRRGRARRPQQLERLHPAQAGGGTFPREGREGALTQDCGPGTSSPSSPSDGPPPGAVFPHSRVALAPLRAGVPPATSLLACHPSPPSWFSRGVLEGSLAPRAPESCPPTHSAHLKPQPGPETPLLFHQEGVGRTLCLRVRSGGARRAGGRRGGREEAPVVRVVLVLLK